MKKAILFAAIAATIVGNRGGSPDQSCHARKHEIGQQELLSTTSVVNTYQRAELAGTPMYKALQGDISPDWVLVVVGIATCFVIAWQSWETRRSAKAAQESAAAGLLNAQAVINSDRPWVVIFSVRDARGVSFRACNIGRTPAEIISFAAKCRCVENISELPAIPEYGTEQVPIIKLLVPGGQLGEADLELLPLDKFASFVEGCTRTRDRTEYALVPGKNLPIFYFRVIYANALSKGRPEMPHHETRMCFRFSPLVEGQPEVCGNEEYNRHT